MADKPQHPPTIDLDGARLRPLCVADADALYAYLGDPVVTELTSYPDVSVPMVEAMIERALNRWAAGELSNGGVALQHDDQLVGTCGFNEWSEVHRWAELAFDPPNHPLQLDRHRKHGYDVPRGAVVQPVV